MSKYITTIQLSLAAGVLAWNVQELATDPFADQVEFPAGFMVAVSTATATASSMATATGTSTATSSLFLQAMEEPGSIGLSAAPHEWVRWAQLDPRPAPSAALCSFWVGDIFRMIDAGEPPAAEVICATGCSTERV